jgi:hypothetical protein
MAVWVRSVPTVTTPIVIAPAVTIKAPAVVVIPAAAAPISIATAETPTAAETAGEVIVKPTREREVRAAARPGTISRPVVT